MLKANQPIIMETFNIICGCLSIISFGMGLFATQAVIKMKKNQQVNSTAGNVTQTATGNGNKQAGGNITH